MEDIVYVVTSRTIGNINHDYVVNNKIEGIFTTRVQAEDSAEKIRQWLESINQSRSISITEYKLDTIVDNTCGF